MLKKDRKENKRKKNTKNESYGHGNMALYKFCIVLYCIVR